MGGTHQGPNFEIFYWFVYTPLIFMSFWIIKRALSTVWNRDFRITNFMEVSFTLFQGEGARFGPIYRSTGWFHDPLNGLEKFHSSKNWPKPFPGPQIWPKKCSSYNRPLKSVQIFFRVLFVTPITAELNFIPLPWLVLKFSWPPKWI